MDIVCHGNGNGLEVWQRNEDGYIHLNPIAKASGKLIRNWLRLDSTRELLEEFGKLNYLRSEIVTGQDYLESEVILPLVAVAGRRYGGTWAHPDIAIQFAQWCSPAFALWVSRTVREWVEMRAGGPVFESAREMRNAARERILQAAEGFLAGWERPRSVEAHQVFADAYNNRELRLPGWVYEAKPCCSRSTLYRWRQRLDEKAAGRRESYIERNPDIRGFVDGFGNGPTNDEVLAACMERFGERAPSLSQVTRHRRRVFGGRENWRLLAG